MHGKNLCHAAVFSVVFLFALAFPVYARDLYVAPNGSDNASGSIDQPLQSLQGAQNKIRSLSIAGKEPVNVYFRGGTYEFTAPVTFGPQDSGTNANPITYQGYQNEQAIFSGGRELTGWHTAIVNGKQVWQTTIPAGLPFPTSYSVPITVPRQLFVNGARATRARNTTIDFSKWTETTIGYQTPTPLVVAHPEDIEVVSRGDIVNSYHEYRCGVASISSTVITMKDPCWTTAQAVAAIPIGKPVWIENAPEFLDQPGDWYADPRTRIISYIPKSGETLTNTTFTIPVLENLVTLNASFLAFRSLTFSYSTSFEASTPAGFTELYGQTRTVAFWAASTTNLTLNYLTFAHTGNIGIHIGSGTPSTNITVTNSTFDDLSSYAVDMTNVGKDGTVVIANNTISTVGQEYNRAGGIQVGANSENVDIEHNTLNNLPYWGIDIYEGDGDPTTSVHIYIGKNRISNAMQVLHDGGSIYTGQTRRPGIVIEKNVITNQAHVYGAIYLDDKDQYMTVQNNVLFDNLCSLHIRGGSHTITNNYWGRQGASSCFVSDIDIQVGPDGCVHNGVSVDCGPNTLTNNHVITSLSQAPTDIVNNAGVISSYTPPTPTPSGKPGDLNDDRKVDIFDYNLLVANFGHPYTIFDYNNIVGNFGK